MVVMFDRFSFLVESPCLVNLMTGIPRFIYSTINDAAEEHMRNILSSHTVNLVKISPYVPNQQYDEIVGYMR